MDNNELYYLVGIAGSGKTTVCKQLAENLQRSVAINTSARFKDYIKKKGVKDIVSLDSIPYDERELLINGLHHEFLHEKSTNLYTFLDGHMWVNNSITGMSVNAMPSKNKGITTGIIFLNTPARLILENIKYDNAAGLRKRKELELNKLMELSEEEFQASEDYCIKNKLKFGVIDNFDKCKRGYNSVRYLNNYYLSHDEKLRTKYIGQFNQKLSPSKLRRCHYNIGKMIIKPFITKSKISQNNCQILSIPRSGNFITNGFASKFDGCLLTLNDLSITKGEFDLDKPLIIIDSVIDTGNTIKEVLKKIPDFYTHPIHIICLSINIKSLGLIESLKDKASFHCLGFSNKEIRPSGALDMGARLYGTLR